MILFQKKCVLPLILIAVFSSVSSVHAVEEKTAPSSTRFEAVKAVVQKRFSVLKSKVSSTIKDPSRAQHIVALKKDGKERLGALEKEYKARAEALQEKYFADLNVVRSEFEARRAALRDQIAREQAAAAANTSTSAGR